MLVRLPAALEVTAWTMTDVLGPPGVSLTTSVAIISADSS